MKPLAALAALTVALATSVSPAFARTSYVIDDAHLLSPTAIAQINQQVGDFNAQTRKEVVVVTTPTLGGVAPDAAIERSFAQQQVNGVEIFIAKNEHEIRIAGTTAASRYFPAGSYQTIARTMRASFKTGDYDGGVENAVSTIVNTYRGHESSLNGSRRPAGAVASPSRSSETGGGFNMGWIWWIIILAVIFFVIRGIFRALSGPRMMGGPGYGPGPGYGGGYGPGYGPGYGGGGGGFWSGLLGGLGGAWLGNELFGGRRDVGDGGGYAAGGFDPGQQADAGGWQDQPGQIDTSNIGGSSWGDAGGGDSGGGWGGGDSGGGWGGGGDSGGGGGDGGW